MMQNGRLLAITGIDMIFVLERAQAQRRDAWLAEQNARVVATQERDPDLARFITVGADGRKHPYFGAAGGSCTYQFTPTSLGTVTKVVFCKGSAFEAELDLTDYQSW